MNEYISRDDVHRFITKAFTDNRFASNYDFAILVDKIDEIPAADVQPLSVIAEHIKNRLYETAFNTSEAVARNVIVDMAERVEWWINELKDGDTE